LLGKRSPAFERSDGVAPQASSLLQRTETGNEGYFRFKDCKAGDFVLRAVGNALGLAEQPVTIGEAGGKATLDLQRGAVVQGRAVAADGAITDGDGRFAFANMPPAAGSALSAGDNALARRSRAGGVRFHRFAVQTGEETLVEPLR